MILSSQILQIQMKKILLISCPAPCFARELFLIKAAFVHYLLV